MSIAISIQVSGAVPSNIENLPRLTKFLLLLNEMGISGAGVSFRPNAEDEDAISIDAEGTLSGTTLANSLVQLQHIDEELGKLGLHFESRHVVSLKTAPTPANSGQDRLIVELGVSVGTYQRLGRAGISTYERLLHHTPKSLRNTPHLGPASVKEIIEALECEGLKLRED